MTVNTRKSGAVAEKPRENLDSICRTALEQFGLTVQMGKVQEECGELVGAINRWENNDPTREDASVALVDEIADVTIMVRQAAIAVGEDVVDIRIQEKLCLLKNRIREGRKNEGTGSSRIIGQPGFSTDN